MLYSEDLVGPWNVLVEPAAIAKAVSEMEELYSGVELKDMHGWLERFLAAVVMDPMGVLGAPPMSLKLDPDLLIFPGDRHARVSGLAKVYRKDKLVLVYSILVRKPSGFQGRLS